MRKLGLFILLVLAAVAFGATTRSSVEGDQPYTPTRTEWLAVELNTSHRKSPTYSHHYSIRFKAVPGSNVIILEAVPESDATPAQIERMKLNQYVIKIIAEHKIKQRGWNKWLVLQTKIRKSAVTSVLDQD